MRQACASAEASTLLALARGDDEVPTGVTFGSLDADRLADLAQWHQVAGLCHWQGRRVPDAPVWSLIAPATRDVFRLAFLHNSMRNEVAMEQVAALHSALAARGIESIFFKGPWMVLAAYPDPGTRPMDDIDLGIHERDYQGAVEVLEALGYQGDRRLPADGAEALQRSHYARQLRFVARARRLVELHFRMVNIGPPSAEEDWVWNTSRTLQVGPATIRVPGAEAMLVHLLLHANQHGFAVLRLLHDLRFALAREADRLDVAAVVRRVRQLRCPTSACFGLRLAAAMARAVVPADLEAQLRPGAVRGALFRRLWHLDRIEALAVPRGDNDGEAARLYCLEMGSLGDKLHYLRTLVREAGGPWHFLRAVWRSVGHRGNSASPMHLEDRRGTGS